MAYEYRGYKGPRICKNCKYVETVGGKLVCFQTKPAKLCSQRRMSNKDRCGKKGMLFVKAEK